PEVVGDEQHRDVALPGQPVEMVEDAALDGGMPSTISRPGTGWEAPAGSRCGHFSRAEGVRGRAVTGGVRRAGRPAAARAPPGAAPSRAASGAARRAR